jgi:hypothetical protein
MAHQVDPGTRTADPGRVETLVWWPSLLLAPLFLDELIVHWKYTSRRGSRMAAAALTWVLAGSAWSLAGQSASFRDWHDLHLLATRRPWPSPVADARVSPSSRRGRWAMATS